MDFETALPYIIGVYVGIWLAVLIYLIVLQVKVAGLRKQVDVLTKAVDKKAAEKAPEAVKA